MKKLLTILIKVILTIVSFPVWIVPVIYKTGLLISDNIMNIIIKE